MRSTDFGPLVGLKMQGGGLVYKYAEGGGKVNMARRGLLGLKNMISTPTENLPAVVPSVAPTPAPSPLATVVEKIEQIPMSRRQFMEKTGKTVASQALQEAAGGLGINALTKMAAKPALAKMTAKSDAEIADTIADYAANILDNEDAVAKAFSISTGQNAREYFDLGDGDFPIYDVLQDISHSGNPESMGMAAKAIGLDIEGISKATGLSAKDVARIVQDDGDLLMKLSDTSTSKNYMNAILEDGRPKEAYRSTSLSDIDEQEVDDIIKSVIKEYGNDADEMDVIGEVSDRVRNRFFEKERGHGGDDPMYGALYKRILDDETLDNVYSQMDDGEDYMGLSDRVLNMLSGE
tara:strand:- start:5475 stop:6524 length:1050 start_codon:yes stop_codon:yes gene_type:complete